MYQRVKKYTSVFGIPMFALISFLGHGWWAFALPILTFVWVPFAELFTEQSGGNFSEEEERKALEDPFYDRLLYLMVPLQFIIIFSGLYLINHPESIILNVNIGAVNPVPFTNGLGTIGSAMLNATLPFSHGSTHLFGSMSLVNWAVWTKFELVGKIFAMGICCGVIGINLGHELGHRFGKFDRFMAKSLLLSSMYMHFIIEHNRGHHNRVATDEDPATARRGEILYFFWIRSIVFGYISAWKLETERLKKMEIPFLSLKNEMIQFVLIQIGFVAFIYMVFGLKGMIAFLLAALIGGLLLETVNYIEHYGLQRVKNPATGVYEKVFPTHSWNSNHKIGRIFLFELTRHSDHHYIASRKYQILRHFDESPQMPFGYPAMLVLATFPPIWFPLMHRHIEKHKQLLATRKSGASYV